MVRGSVEAEFMSSVYRDLVAFQDEIFVEVEEALPGFPARAQGKIRSELELLRAERARLSRSLGFWNDAPDAAGERRSLPSSSSVGS